MSTHYKHQEEFAAELADLWIAGDHKIVRGVIRKLKNKAQAAYIGAAICDRLVSLGQATQPFIDFMHPNNKPERKSDHV